MLLNRFRLVSCVMGLFHVVVCYGTVSGWYRVSWGCFTMLLYVIELFQVGIVCHGAVLQCDCMLLNCFRLVSCVMGLFQVVIVCYGTVSGWYRVSWGCFMLLLYVMELFQVGIVCHGAVSCCCMLWNCFRSVSYTHLTLPTRR